MRPMDPTLLAGSALVLLGSVACIAMTAFFFVFVFWRIRVGQRRKREAVAGAPSPESLAPTIEARAPAPPPPPPAKRTAQPLSSNAPIAAKNTIPDADPTERMPLRPTGHPDEQTSPSQPDAKPLLGFFDDETTGGASESAATELFQRGAKAFDWDDDDDDDYDATEVFSAHHATELAGEFEIEDD